MAHLHEMGSSYFACSQCHQQSQAKVNYLAGDNLGRLGLIIPNSNRLPYTLFVA